MKLANMNSGKSLRQLMSRDGISRSKMAEVLGCTETTVSQLRHSKGIAGSKLAEICEFFKISASDYFKLGEE
jgi:transcriptional regulator with XRE-family HTH domain